MSAGESDGSPPESPTYSEDVEGPAEHEVDQVEGEPKLYATWMAALQAELMLGHLAAARPAFPEANLYCHACITAMRSVTAMIQKALRHDDAERHCDDPEGASSRAGLQ
jgi:hypothetical protein